MKLRSSTFSLAFAMAIAIAIAIATAIAQPAAAGTKDVESTTNDAAPAMAESPPTTLTNPNWVSSQVSAMIRSVLPRSGSWGAGASAGQSTVAMPRLDDATVRQLIARGKAVEFPICPTYVQASGGRNGAAGASGVSSTTQCIVQGLSIGGSWGK